MKPDQNNIRCYRAIISPPDKNGLIGVEVAGGMGVNGCGRTRDEAVFNATMILQSVINDLTNAGEPVPLPMDDESFDDYVKEFAHENAIPTLLLVHMPTKSVRINITLSNDLIQHIDLATNNRSAFLTEAAWAKLREG